MLRFRKWAHSSFIVAMKDALDRPAMSVAGQTGH